MGSDVKHEAEQLFAEGRSAAQVRLELERRGFAADDVALQLETKIGPASVVDRSNARLLGMREFLDRIGYGAAAPQFINILFWLSQQFNPYILAIVGALNVLKTVFSVVLSNFMQDYAQLHRVTKNTIAAAGIIFGFSFLFMAFGLLWRNVWIFSFSFLVGSIGIVAYGDLYQKFVRETIRKERMSGLLRNLAHWGILITAITLLLAGYLLDQFPMAGVVWTFTLFGTVHSLKVYGFLLAFEITAFAFIVAGYVSSLVTDTREKRTYNLRQFTKEYVSLIRHKLHVFVDKYVFLLTLAAALSGFVQLVIMSYSGIAMYDLFSKRYASPFSVLAIVYVIAILASFVGQYFTRKIHKSIGLAPMLVFGTLLMAILPLALVKNQRVEAITAGLAVYIIGGTIVGIAQGMLAQKLMNDDVRRAYFKAQSFVIAVPYLALLPFLALVTLYWPATALNILFLGAAACLAFVVMPIYFALVIISQKSRL